MRIIYTYKKNRYAAYKAAYLHLGIDINLIGNTKDIKEDIKPYYLGLDKDLNEVYISNSGRNTNIFNNIILGLSNIYNEDIKTINFN